MYLEEDYIMISGIQHFAYCKRQWALIHVEHQWEQNLYTVKGDIVHEKVDDPFLMESRGNLIISRSVPVQSELLGCYGIADLIEYHQSEEGIEIPGKEGFYRLYPIEYKAGKPKDDNIDKVQLCLQAMCIEEMHNIKVPEGAIYYAKVRRREKVVFTQELRQQGQYLIAEMHQLIRDSTTPRPSYSKICDHCSLYNICLPKSKSKFESVDHYINSQMAEEIR